MSFGPHRGNALGYDLNRNFPDNAATEPHPQQKEVTNVVNWIQKTNFLLSANLHGGTLVVNYPYDSYPGGKCGIDLRYNFSPSTRSLKTLGLSVMPSAHVL